MNLLTLRNQVKEKLPGVSVANSAIYQQLNNGYFAMVAKIAKINEDFFEQQKVKSDLVQNTALYSLPTDLIKFKQLRLAYTTPTSESDYRIATAYDPAQVDNVQTDEENIATSNPIVDITNTSYRIKPTPTANSTNGRELYYIARPSAMALTGDTPVISSDYHDLIASYASAEIAGWSGDYKKQNMYDKIYRDGVKEMLKELAPRNINVQERMRNVLETTNKKTTTELWD